MYGRTGLCFSSISHFLPLSLFLSLSPFFVCAAGGRYLRDLPLRKGREEFRCGREYVFQHESMISHGWGRHILSEWTFDDFVEDQVGQRRACDFFFVFHRKKFPRGFSSDSASIPPALGKSTKQQIHAQTMFSLFLLPLSVREDISPPALGFA